MSFAKKIVKPILRAAFRLLFRTKIHGRFPETWPAKLLICSNHESFLDGLILALLLPIEPVFVVHTWVANNFWFKLGLSLVDYAALDPASPMAIKSLAKIIDQGRPVVIFPEGRITVTGSLMKIYEGPAFLAAKTGAQILPVRLDGPARSYFSRLGEAHPKRLVPQIEATLLPLRSIPMPDAPRAKERRKICADALRSIMQKAAFDAAKSLTLWETFSNTASLQGKGEICAEDIQIRKGPDGKDINAISAYSYRKLMAMGSLLGRIAETSVAEKRFGLLLPNSAATLALILGSTARGKTPCMLNYTAGAGALQSALSAAECKTVVSSRMFILKAKLGETQKALEAQGYRFLWIEQAAAAAPWSAKARAFADALAPHAFPLCKSPEDEAVVLFTSGSEGSPKGVVLSHRAILANASQIRSVMDITPEDKFLCALPMFHSFGLTAGCILPLASGSRLFVYPSPLHYRVIPEIAYSENCTVLFGTNTFLAQYGKYANPYDFCKVRRVVAGAEKLQNSTRELWNDKFGIRIFEGYGATETAPVVAVNTPMLFKRGSVGHILPGIEFRVEPVPGVEEGGLLHVKGPNLMSGYLKADNPGVLIPPASEAGPGWHNLGDIVRIDSEGFLHIVGRIKRFAKIAGEMVSLEIPEKIAAAACPDAKCACVSVADPAKGEALVLFVSGAKITRDMLVAAAKAGGVPEIAIPRDIRPIQDIPLLGTGKTDYAALNRLAQNA